MYFNKQKILHYQKVPRKSFRLILAYVMMSLIVSCKQSKLLITDRNIAENKIVELDTIHHTQPNDQGFAISTYFPLPNLEINGDGLVADAFSVDIRYRHLKFGELALFLSYRDRQPANFSGNRVNQTSVLQPIGLIDIKYSFPILKWEKEKLTKMVTPIESQNKTYQTRFSSPVQKSINVRIGINNASCHELIPTTSQVKWLHDLLSGEYTESEIIQSNYFSDYIEIDQLTQSINLGVGLKQIQYLFYQGKHPDLGSFKSKKNNYSQFYIDALFLLNSKVSSNKSHLNKINDPYYSNDDEYRSEIVNYTPYLKKRNIGFCLGYYKEFYINGSNSMFTLKTELGIRPGYFNEVKGSTYFNLGLGFGGGFGFKHKRKWRDKFL